MNTPYLFVNIGPLKAVNALARRIEYVRALPYRHPHVQLTLLSSNQDREQRLLLEIVNPTDTRYRGLLENDFATDGQLHPGILDLKWLNKDEFARYSSPGGIKAEPRYLLPLAAIFKWHYAGQPWVASDLASVTATDPNHVRELVERLKTKGWLGPPSHIIAPRPYTTESWRKLTAPACASLVRIKSTLGNWPQANFPVLASVMQGVAIPRDTFSAQVVKVLLSIQPSGISVIAFRESFSKLSDTRRAMNIVRQLIDTRMLDQQGDRLFVTNPGATALANYLQEQQVVDQLREHGAMVVLRSPSPPRQWTSRLPPQNRRNYAHIVVELSPNPSRVADQKPDQILAYATLRLKPHVHEVHHLGPVNDVHRLLVRFEINPVTAEQDIATAITMTRQYVTHDARITHIDRPTYKDLLFRYWPVLPVEISYSGAHRIIIEHLLRLKRHNTRAYQYAFHFSPFNLGTEQIRAVAAELATAQWFGPITNPNHIPHMLLTDTGAAAAHAYLAAIKEAGS